MANKRRADNSSKSDTGSKRGIQNQATLTSDIPLTQSSKCEKGSAVVHAASRHQGAIKIPGPPSYRPLYILLYSVTVIIYKVKPVVERCRPPI